MKSPRPYSMLATALFAVVVWQFAATASAQRPMVDPYQRVYTTRPTVSPYLNLAEDENGISNYSSLVRPMLAQRELLQQQQDEELARMRARARGYAGEMSPQARNPRGGRPVGQFMQYSHYFGVREAAPR